MDIENEPKPQQSQEQMQTQANPELPKSPKETEFISNPQPPIQTPPPTNQNIQIPPPPPTITYTRHIDISQFLPSSQNLVSEYKCPLCQGIYFKPIIDQCGHIFCEQCFESYFKVFKTCPISNNTLNTKPPKVLVISHILDKQSLHCNNKSNGCNWEGFLKDLEDHIQTKCPKEEVSCEHEGCGQKMFRETLISHKTKCEFRVIECDDCKIKLPFNKLIEHQEICPKFKIDCSQKCGEKIEREQLNDHIDTECKLTLLNCPFEKYGCKHDKIYRQDMTQRLKDDASEHLLLIFPTLDDVKIVKEDIGKLQKDVEGLIKEMVFNRLKNKKKENLNSNITIPSKGDSFNLESKSLSQLIKRGRSPSNLLSDYTNNQQNSSSNFQEATTKVKQKEEAKNGEIISLLHDDEKENNDKLSDIPLSSQTMNKVYDICNMSSSIFITGSVARFLSTNRPDHKFLFSSKSIDLTAPIETFSWSVRFLTTSMWIGVGLCDKDQVIQNKMKFASRMSQFNHGSFLLSSNGYTWNCSLENENNVPVDDMPQMGKGAVLDMEYNLKERKLIFKNNDRLVVLTNVYPIIKDSAKLTPCIIFLHNGDSAEMIIK